MLALSDLIGETVFEYKIEEHDDNYMTFLFTNGYELDMRHHQDCCESVEIEDIEGDLNNLIGRPLVLCEEASNTDPNAGESATWTFYRFATDQGYVTVRWYGSSNGYYSERVSTDIRFSEEVLEKACAYIRDKLTQDLPDTTNTRSKLKI